MVCILVYSTYSPIFLPFYTEDSESDTEQEDVDPHAGRFVRYQFTPQFLKLKTVGAT